ncbi:MAG TPA: TIGR03435 family protein [Terracidiphilus sp.]|nr:TIGR03435 family protein [Terracidiphilus sp.]
MDERKAMLQNLLADRFKLVVHHQPKDFPLYALVVAKGGPKLQEAKPEEILHSGLDGRPMCQHARGGRGVIHLEGCTVGDLAQTLSNWIMVNRGRAVVDQTGLTGRYTITLQWTPDDAPATPQQDYSGPSMLTAVKEQLGLELKPIKGPLDTIVIDRVEMPSEN